ncbi:hypothetical protein Sjap_018168 [Stephania japonica]|uniref:Uncharacterized protein n=1 Tax=Stephania japonica TaxID=461633 RepID=A0AAP0NK89_9MAGN
MEKVQESQSFTLQCNSIESERLFKFFILGLCIIRIGGSSNTCVKRMFLSGLRITSPNDRIQVLNLIERILNAMIVVNLWFC